MVKSIVRAHYVIGKVQYFIKINVFEYYIIARECVN